MKQQTSRNAELTNKEKSWFFERSVRYRQAFDKQDQEPAKEGTKGKQKNLALKMESMTLSPEETEITFSENTIYNFIRRKILD